LTSAAFARTSPLWITVWIGLSLGALGPYIGALVEFVKASGCGDETISHAGRVGVVWLSIMGGLMGSLIIGMIVVSRISPWMSSWFVRMPSTPPLVIDEID